MLASGTVLSYAVIAALGLKLIAAGYKRDLNDGTSGKWAGRDDAPRRWDADLIADGGGGPKLNPLIEYPGLASLGGEGEGSLRDGSSGRQQTPSAPQSTRLRIGLMTATIASPYRTYPCISD